MSTNCIRCGVNRRTGFDLLCDDCRPTAIDHFLALARRGKPCTGASGGELRARQLALAILEQVPGLDAQAIKGAAEFMGRVANAPQASRELIDAAGEESPDDQAKCPRCGRLCIDCLHERKATRERP
jgi:hypothetical protein